MTNLEYGVCLCYTSTALLSKKSGQEPNWEGIWSQALEGTYTSSLVSLLSLPTELGLPAPTTDYY